MKILHTADWHLGYARDKMDPLEEQRAVLDEMCRHFYHKSQGALPEEMLVRLFMELASPGESVAK